MKKLLLAAVAVLTLAGSAHAGSVLAVCTSDTRDNRLFLYSLPDTHKGFMMDEIPNGVEVSVMQVLDKWVYITAIKAQNWPVQGSVKRRDSFEAKITS